MKFPRAMYSLRMSFWTVPRELLARHALLLGDELVEQQQHRGRRVDRHRGRDLVERDAVEGHPHVLERVDRHAGAADLAQAARVVGVQAELGRQVEGHAEARGPVLEQVLVALVGLAGGGVAGVLAHRPAALAVHLAVDPAREGKLARLAEVEVLGHVRLVVERLDLDPGVREAARIVRADDRRDGEVGRVLVLDGHGRRVPLACGAAARGSPSTVTTACSSPPSVRAAISAAAMRVDVDHVADPEQRAGLLRDLAVARRAAPRAGRRRASGPASRPRRWSGRRG